MKFTVAIIGRPNVGKSTLFNRLVGKKLALVHDLPGVTRDRRGGEGRISDMKFDVIDTAGLEEALDDSLEGRMRRQTLKALEEADVALLLVDARAGITPLDRHFADFFRKSKTPIILVANKCEGAAGEPGLYESYSLGLGDPVPLSAEHGEGMADLYEALLPYAEKAEAEAAAAEEEKEAGKPLQLAIVGRPNAGKSTLVNYLVGEERMLTGPEAGVTRDSIAVEWEYEGQPVKLVDTAGIRRRARVSKQLEKLSVADSLRVIRMAEVVVLLIDGELLLEKQDLTLASHVVEEGRALVVAINKWDLVKDRQAALRQVRDKLSTSLPQVRGIPVVTLSAKTGRGIERLLPAVLKVYETWNKRLPTAPLNRWLSDMLDRHQPPMVKGKRLRIRYITQIKGRPPTFTLFVSSRGELPESYLRFLANGLRDDFGLEGVPLRFNLRSGKNPYV